MSTAQKAYFDFGNIDNYIQTGGTLPKGRYVAYFDFMMRTPQDKQGNIKGAAVLSVHGTMYNMEDLTAEPKEHFWGMGKKAHESFLPDPDDPKRLVMVPQGSPYADNRTNWYHMLKSLYDCGLPPGLLNDENGPTLTPLDGTWLDMDNVPEPADRAGIQNAASSGEVAPELRKLGTMSVCQYIPDEGKPWEGTGGWPEVAPVKAAPPAPGRPKPNGKAATPPVQTAGKPPAPKPPAGRPQPPKPPARSAGPPQRPAAPAEAEPPVQEVEGEDTHINAISVVGDVMAKNVAGLTVAKLRVETIKGANKKFPGQETIGSNIIDFYFSDNDSLNALMGELGYQLDKTGSQIIAG